MTPSLETRRLLLCPIALADAEQVQKIFPQWEIVRYLANRVPWPYPPDAAHNFYRDVRCLPSSAAKRGFGPSDSKATRIALSAASISEKAITKIEDSGSIQRTRGKD